jgi:two-component system phosphate regulon sensor histidine kinase PhoR
VRRLLVVNALIFAVLAAAVALAFYGFSYTNEVGSPERELQMMRDLAEEKRLNIEALIDESDTKLFRNVQLEPLSIRELQEAIRSSNAAIASVFVLDDKLELVLGGYQFNDTEYTPQRAATFRNWFLTNVLPHLPLKVQQPGVRGHMFDNFGSNTPYLFSFTRKVKNDRTFYIVVQDSLTHLVALVFPQFFITNSPRLYQVIDQDGRVLYGSPYVDNDPNHSIEVQFSETVDKWKLHVSQKDIPDAIVIARRRIVNSLLVGGAVTVIILGLGFLVIAIRRERRANELKSDFISNVSHELKTPLSIISMFGEMLAAGRTKSAEQAAEYAEIIWRESVRLGRLIDNVLDFAKIERGMGVYEFAESDIGEVVHRAIEVPQRRLATAEMTLEVDIEPELPPISLDANAFTLAVLNLIDNAIKYAADGKKLAVKLYRDGDLIRLSVRDWGPGIDPAEQEAIFDRFYRARAIRLKPIRGSGIGLALVRHIARAHHGDVTVDSVPGAGSTFQIWLPIGDRT